MPTFADPVEDWKKPKLNANDLIGFVVDNDDRQSKDGKQRQRVRIRIPQLHRGVPDDKLPWCIPDASQNTNNAGGGAGSVNVPVKGAKIYVRLDDNDPHNPRYGGSPTTDDVNEDNELLKEDYPHTRGSTDIGGNRTNVVNTEKETIDSTHKSGTTQHIDANGTVSQMIASDWNVGVEGNINIVAKGKVFINGTEVRFNEPGKEAGSATARQRPTVADPKGKTGY